MLGSGLKYELDALANKDFRYHEDVFAEEAEGRRLAGLGR